MELSSSWSSLEPSGKVGARDWLSLATGLNLAFAVCYLTLTPPAPYSITLFKRVGLSTLSVAAACLIGWSGTRVTLPYRSKRHLGHLAQAGFRGWVFLPSIALFLKHESLWAQIIAGGSAMLMADYISRFIEALSRSDDVFSWRNVVAERAMFMTEALIAPRSPVPFYVSLCLFGAFGAAAAHWVLIEMFLVSLSIFLTVVQIKSMYVQALWDKSQRRSHSYALVAVALCLTFIAFAPFINSLGTAFTGWSRPRLLIGTGRQKAPAVIFHTIVLWPKKSEEKVEATFAMRRDTLSSGRAKVWSIPFTGPYWYTKIAGAVPDAQARVTQGDPLKVNVRSADRSPLIMEAHQHLAEPIDLACCRELQVVIQNDTVLGATEICLTLGDSEAKRSDSLGTKEIAPGNSDLAHGGLLTSETTLSFPVPHHGMIERFDEITVELKSEEKRLTLGRKVAVERFIFIPR